MMKVKTRRLKQKESMTQICNDNTTDSDKI